MEKFLEEAAKEAYEAAMAEYYSGEEAAIEAHTESCSAYKTGICKGGCEKCYHNSTDNDPYPGYVPKED